jgi:hypothetical protein
MNVTVDTIEAQLEEAAENLPGPHRPDSKSWGQSFAHEALVGADDAVRAKIGEVFDRFLERGTPEQAALAASTYPERAGALDGILAGLERQDLADETREALLGALGRAIEAEQLPWDPSYRDLVGPGARRALLCGALIWDHGWFLENLQSLLGDAPSSAATALWFAVQPLRAAEAERLRQELEARRADLGDKWVDRALKVIDSEAKKGRFSDPRSSRF